MEYLSLRRTPLDNEIWKERGIDVPGFNVKVIRENTFKTPKWVHIGVGNIFRGFIAKLQQALIKMHKEETGIIGVEVFDYEIVESIMKRYNNLTLAVSILSDGRLEKEVSASVVETLFGDPKNRDWETLKLLFQEPTLQMCSLTITEKGYNLRGADDEYYMEVLFDINSGPSNPKTTMAKVTSLLYTRFKTNALPIALVSFDNFARNGEKLHQSIREIASGWVNHHLVEIDFLDYIDKVVTYPWTMIDKIVPSPSEEILKHLLDIGLIDMEPIVTKKKTYIAPFVNMEHSQYLIVEDNFPNGRPDLDVADRNIFFADRETVEKSERMKVTACLNPLHTTLAIFGCLLGYKKIYEEMENPLLKQLVEGVGEEGLRVVENPSIIDPKQFLREVIDERLPNKYLPDTPQRIATDTSQKMPVRFGETILSYSKRSDLGVHSLRYIPLVIAGWCRYLLGVDDEGIQMELSPDPQLNKLRSYLSTIEFGKPNSLRDQLYPILSSTEIFRVNLYEVGLATKIERLFKEMITGPGAVKGVIQKYVLMRNH